MVQNLHYVSRPLEYRRYLRFENKLRRNKKEFILVCEHLPVITSGVNFTEKSLLADAETLKKQNIDFIKTGRGGDVTAHEPGQCVIYPHIDIAKRKIQVSKFFETLIKITSENLLRAWNIETVYDKARPGLYLKNGKKIASVGISFKQFFTAHGIAVNIENTLSTFRHILPCGHEELKMTSVLELEKNVKLKDEFARSWICDFQKYLTELPPSHMHS